ncbi:hypothetical protein [Streptomyces sp. FxanaC1]|uniref:hypothetical protein n=1 Tax=Streptomyces sp. FxanaC1 TaxID=1157640 RepID=UPI00039C29E7|nr:hypothetical protein [Streptomyces sp. FxanaC1]
MDEGDLQPVLGRGAAPQDAARGSYRLLGGGHLDTSLNRADAYYLPPAIADASLRRR